MTEITNVTRLHDERLLELRQELGKALARVDDRIDTLRRIAGQHKSYSSRSQYTWRKSRTDGTHASLQDAIEAVEAMVAAGDTYVPMYSGAPSKYLAAYTEAAGFVAAARSAIEAHEADYTGWNRYWLCCSSNGHVHHAHCSSFRLNTRIALVPSLSGASVEAAVASLGPIMCTKCYPSAPTEWTDSKLPESVITVLYDQGEEAFRTALEAWKIKQMNKKVK